MRNHILTEIKPPQTKFLALASLCSIAALIVVGTVSSGVLRHIVQTSPSWLTVYFGFRNRGMTKWMALPTYIFWMLIMVLIWLYLVGWASIVTGHYSGTEKAMTIVVLIASALGILDCFRIKSEVRWATALTISLAVGMLQIGAFWLSLQPGIANR